jgi:hypothetical protein
MDNNSSKPTFIAGDRVRLTKTGLLRISISVAKLWGLAEGSEGTVEEVWHDPSFLSVRFDNSLNGLFDIRPFNVDKIETTETKKSEAGKGE